MQNENASRGVVGTGSAYSEKEKSWLQLTWNAIADKDEFRSAGPEIWVVHEKTYEAFVQCSRSFGARMICKCGAAMLRNGWGWRCSKRMEMEENFMEWILKIGFTIGVIGLLMMLSYGLWQIWILK